MGRKMTVTSFQTIVEAIAAFDASGYREIFRAQSNGLCASHVGRTFPPNLLKVDHRARIEGDSNPDEETLVFALRDPDSDLKGTYTVAFGPNMDALDADTLVLLK